MASESIQDILEWAETDNKRFLHVVYRVGDLDKTIKLANLLAFCICYEWYLCFLDDFHSPQSRGSHTMHPVHHDMRTW